MRKLFIYLSFFICFINNTTQGICQNQINVLYYRLNLSLNPDSLGINGSVLTIFQCKSTINKIDFVLSDTLKIDSIIYHQSKPEFIHNKNLLSINFLTSITENQIDSIEVFYSGEPKINLSPKSFNRSVHDTVPIIWTQSEPYGSGDWWPCIDNLTDKIDSIDIVLKCPSKYRSASNGILLLDTIINNSRISTWKHRYPIATYLVGVAVTNYILYNDTAIINNDTMPIMNFVFPESYNNFHENSFATAIMMNFFNNNFTSYPFIKEKYGHAMIPGWGGMEHQTITFLGSYNYMLVCHELAHHWFGDMITCSSWKDIWLNEGFATYTSNMILEYIPSPNGFDAWRKSTVESIVSVTDGSVWVDDTTNVSRVFNGRLSYEKGAMVLHLLRRIMGDNDFLKAMKNYSADTNFRFNFASTANFMKCIRKASNKVADNFEQQWIYGQGFPIFNINAHSDATGIILLNLTQNSSHNSVPFFYTSLEVKLQNSFLNKDTTIVFEINKPNENFIINIGFKPDSVIINPNYHLITPMIKSKVNIIDNLTSSILFPNPATTSFSIFSTNSKLIKAEILDINGHKIFEIIDDNFFNIDISNLSVGIYFVRLQNTNGDFSILKLVKV